MREETSIAKPTNLCICDRSDRARVNRSRTRRSTRSLCTVEALVSTACRAPNVLIDPTQTRARLAHLLSDSPQSARRRRIRYPREAGRQDESIARAGKTCVARPLRSIDRVYDGDDFVDGSFEALEIGQWVEGHLDADQLSTRNRDRLLSNAGALRGRVHEQRPQRMIRLDSLRDPSGCVPGR